MIIDIPSNLFSGASRIYLDHYAASKASLYLHREPPHLIGYQFHFNERPDQLILAGDNILAGIGYAAADRFILEKIPDGLGKIALMMGGRQTRFLALFEPNGFSTLLDGIKRIK